MNQNNSRFLKIFLMLVLTSVLLISSLSPALGYEYDKEYVDPWDHSPITVYIDDINVPDGYDPQYREDVISSMNWWEGGGNGKLSYLVDFNLIDSKKDADIVILWVKEIDGGVIGVCEYEVLGDAFRDVTITLECGSQSGIVWFPHNDKNMETTVKHELGHALGLGHSTDSKDIMHESFELKEGIPPQFTGPITEMYFSLLPFILFILPLILIMLIIRTVVGKNKPDDPNGGIFKLLNENDIKEVEDVSDPPPKEYMGFYCKHCGYKTTLWNEIEMKACPECKNTAHWISSDKDKHTENELLGGMEFEHTKNIKIPELLIDQVLGQEHGVEVINKAAKQRRHIMMIGTPGTGKSMLAKGMAELLPKEELQDVLVYHNPEDSNTPKIRVLPAGKGKEVVQLHKLEARKKTQSRSMVYMLIIFGIIIFAILQGQILMGVLVAAMVFVALRYVMPKDEVMVLKLLVSNQGLEKAPFLDATGSHAGALLGDVRHDPFQSGGLETPSHDRVESGAIHKAHKGVLFIDEINTLRIESQQSLLTALQEGKFSITGQSERSSGAMVKTEPVPCNFVMVAAGNLDAVQGMHPALRSRIKGYGYEVYMKETMEDTPENRRKLIRFVAQEVEKDEKIPHFTSEACAEIIREARRRAGRKGQLTLILRDLGGLVRVAGDVARSDGTELTTAKHVLEAKKMSRSVEQQLADQYLERRKDYKMFKSEGAEIGRVNGLAVIGDSGVMLPIIAEVTPAQSKEEGRVIATGRLQEIAQEAVQNVSAIIKKFTGKDISSKDVHIQFVGTYEGVEGDSASVSVATAVISALEGIPIDQSVAMTGSLSVRGDVLPVGGVTHKIEAAALAGVKKVLIPKSNMGDVLIEAAFKDKIKIIPVSSIGEVLEYSLIGVKKQSFLVKIKQFAKEAKLGISIPDKALPQ